MNTLSYTIGGGLSPEQLQRLHRAALRVLEQIGVAVDSEVIRCRVAGQPGVRVDGARLRLAPELVDRLIDEHRQSTPAGTPPDDDFFVDVSGGYCFQLLDPGDNRLRAMTTADCVRLAGLVDGLYVQGVRGGNPGLPQDVPPSLREVLAYKISLEHTRDPGWPGFTSWANGQVMLAMAQAAGQPIGLSVFVLDPLTVAGPTVDMAVAVIDGNVDMDLAVCAMPMIGVSTPAMLPAAFVENTATVLAGFALFKLIGADIGICPMVYPFDMKHGALAYGTPEHVTAWLIYFAETALVAQRHTQETIDYQDLSVRFLVSEYVEGELLSEFLARQPGKRISVFQGLHLLYALAKGIESIHNLREYHGDLHDENVIIRRYGLAFDLKLMDMFHWGPASQENISDDVCNLIRIFYDAIGGQKRYAKQPAEAKAICRGLKRSLILKKFRTAGQLRQYLETMQWD